MKSKNEEREIFSTGTNKRVSHGVLPYFFACLGTIASIFLTGIPFDAKEFKPVPSFSHLS